MSETGPASEQKVHRRVRLSTKQFWVIGLTWLLYCGLSILAVRDNKDLQLTKLQTVLVQITIFAPFLAIWLWAAVGVRRFDAFIAEASLHDQRGLKLLKTSLELLLVGLILTSLVGAIRNLALLYGIGIAEVTIVLNYLYVIAYDVAFTFFALGVERIAAQADVRLSWPTRITIATLFLTVGAALVWATFTNTERQTVLSPGHAATFYLPDIWIAATLVLPVLAAWGIGFYSLARLRATSSGFSASLFRNYLHNLYRGYARIFLSVIILHLLQYVGYPRLIALGLGGILIVIYIFLLFQGWGFYLVGMSAESRLIIQDYARQLIEAGLDPILTLDTQGRITDTNHACAELMSKPAHELVGSDFRSLAASPEAADAILNLVLKHNSIRDRPITLKNSHEIHLLCNGSVFRDSTGRDLGMLVTLRDVTEEKLAAAKIKAALEFAEKASQAKSQFLANMSHELRTPLNAIIGYSDMLLEDDLSNVESAKSDLGRIKAAGRHLLDLINDILDISRIEANKMPVYSEKFALKNLVENVAQTVQPLMSKNANRFSVSFDVESEYVYADQTRIRQCLYNLLSNAAKFTDHGEITMTVKEDGNKVRFTVRDNGIGIPPEKLESLFDPFVQADTSTTRKYGGTGLGLSLTKRIVGMMQGSISVESAPGNGSVFEIILPILEKAGDVYREPAHPEHEVVTAQLPSGAHKVLVIDDDPQVADLIGRLLKKHHITVISALTGEKGLELAKKELPDAILLDVLIPRLDGWEVLKRLKAAENLRHIPVIMVTVTDNRELAFANGVIDFIMKPIDFNHLLSIISKLLPDDGKNVLIVDDEEYVRKPISIALRQEGWSVSEASNGEEALEILRNSRPELIILDLIMPKMDGFQLLERLRSNEENSQVPVLIMTAKNLSPDDIKRLNGHTNKFFSDKSLHLLGRQILKIGHKSEYRIM